MYFFLTQLQARLLEALDPPTSAITRSTSDTMHIFESPPPIYIPKETTTKKSLEQCLETDLKHVRKNLLDYWL